MEKDREKIVKASMSFAQRIEREFEILEEMGIELDFPYKKEPGELTPEELDDIAYATGRHRHEARELPPVKTLPELEIDNGPILDRYARMRLEYLENTNSHWKDVEEMERDGTLASYLEKVSEETKTLTELLLAQMLLQYPAPNITKEHTEWIRHISRLRTEAEAMACQIVIYDAGLREESAKKIGRFGRQRALHIREYLPETYGYYKERGELAEYLANFEKEAMEQIETTFKQMIKKTPPLDKAEDPQGWEQAVKQMRYEAELEVIHSFVLSL
jgi:hypothetical protein